MLSLPFLTVYAIKTVSIDHLSGILCEYRPDYSIASHSGKWCTALSATPKGEYGFDVRMLHLDRCQIVDASFHVVNVDLEIGMFVCELSSYETYILPFAASNTLRKRYPCFSPCNTRQ